MSSLPRLQATIRGARGVPGISNIVSTQEFIIDSTDGQEKIIFPVGKEYNPNTNSVFIFVDGLAVPQRDYIEESPNVIRLITPLSAERTILVKYINFEETDGIEREVIASDVEPTQITADIRDGLIWFDTRNLNFTVYSKDEEGFVELAFRRDFDSPTVIIPMDGGSF